MKNSIRNKKMKDIENSNFPFLTEINISKYKNNDYKSTVNIVYNSANKELEIQKNFDKKRRKINDIFGINNIPQLSIYDDILFKKSEYLQFERYKRAKKLNKSQKYKALSDRERTNYKIDNEIKMPDKIEKNLFKKLNKIKNE